MQDGVPVLDKALLLARLKSMQTMLKASSNQVKSDMRTASK